MSEQSKFTAMYKKLKKYRVPYKVSFIVVGIASTIWFLIRVIPKPSRATYPCMRAAAPFMSSFIVYLLGITGSAMLFKRTGRFLKRSRFILATAAFLGAIVVFAFTSNLNLERVFAGTKAFEYATDADFPANEPMGEELGIFPGRVVWEWDPDATNEDCTNAANGGINPDGYFLPQNSDQAVINRMTDDVIKKLTGTYNVGEGWDMLFRDFNERKGRGSNGFEDGQTIFIKINQGAGGWASDKNPGDDLSYASWAYNGTYPNAESSAAMAIAILRQLINEYGIPQESIYIGDPNAHIFKENYDQMVALFPNVKYMDKNDYFEGLGRTTITKTSEEVFIWSDPTVINAAQDTRYSWNEVVNADYLINLAVLKAHARAGVTLTAKNHFGTHANPDGASPLHNGLVCHVDNDVKDPIRNEYGQYRVLTDIMGHEKLGGNTVLFLVEGLWGGPEAVSKPVKWQSAPFNNDWPSSILASQDAVALESVCYDMLRTEWGDPSSAGIGRPLYGAVDDHLHQAADKDNWPKGFTYDPEGDGTPMSSMGVHEHWNNAEDRQYSRNLGYDYGIELIADKSLVPNAVKVVEAGTLPVINGDPADACWDEAQWYDIDQTWINYGESIDSADFFGRFKMSWSSSENLLYYLVEITDDAFVDGYVYPNDGYPDFDIVEVFIDEDMSGGLHVFDGTAGGDWGENAENAFSYHIAVDAPADGSSTSSKVVCDIDGTNWTDKTIPDYAGHFPELTMKKIGNKYYYEFSMAVYDDTYDHSNPEASRVDLVGNKEVGMSLAYCDNDTPGTTRDNFFGSVWVPAEAYNDHWMNADGFGRARLIKGAASSNQAVEVIGSISDFTVMDDNTELVVHDDLGTVFNDPDGDILLYEVSCTEPKLTFTAQSNVLKVNASANFAGEPLVTVTASDGLSSASVSFNVVSGISGVEVIQSIPDLELPQLNYYTVAHSDLTQVFSDPRGKGLSFSAASEQDALQFYIFMDVLKVRANADFQGSAEVVVTASDGITEASTSFMVSLGPLGLNSNEMTGEMRCYPNPVQDLVTIDLALENAWDGQAVISLYGMDGSLLQQHSGESLQGGRGQLTLDLGSEKPGYYILRLNAGERELTTMIQKQ